MTSTRVVSRPRTAAVRALRRWGGAHDSWSTALLDDLELLGGGHE
jgi:hypothetical protein